MTILINRNDVVSRSMYKEVKPYWTSEKTEKEETACKHGGRRRMREENSENIRRRNRRSGNLR